MYLAKFFGILPKTFHLGQAFRRDSPMKALIVTKYRVANDEKIDRNLISSVEKAPYFMNIRGIRVRREYCDSDSTISHTFPVCV